MEACTPYISATPHEIDDRAPILVLCADPAVSRLEPILARSGWRAVTVSPDSLPDRMEIQADATCLLVEADGLESIDWEGRLRETTGVSNIPILLSGSASSIDRMAAFSMRNGEDILVDPSAMDLALAVEMTRPERGASRVGDVGAEPSAARLRQLSDEVGRIAATLARLSAGPSGVATELPRLSANDGDAPDVSGEQVRAVIRARRARARYFDSELFADPAWDMLLDLLQAEIAQHRVPVSSLCIAAAVPPTTALRWIKTMTDAGLFNRRADPHDGRRIFVELAPQASTALRRYFAEAVPVPGA